MDYIRSCTRCGSNKNIRCQMQCFNLDLCHECYILCMSLLSDVRSKMLGTEEPLIQDLPCCINKKKIQALLDLIGHIPDEGYNSVCRATAKAETAAYGLLKDAKLLCSESHKDNK